MVSRLAAMFGFMVLIDWSPRFSSANKFHR